MAPRYDISLPKRFRGFFAPFSLLLLLAPVSLPSRAADLGIWHRDYASGMKEAKEEGKMLMVVFTGTDWIEICGKFYDEILGDPGFIEAVSKEFALVKLEYPKDNVLPREEAVQKALLREAYRVRGFPTVVLTDVEGRPFGINGYQPVSPKVYADQLLGIEANHTLSRVAVEKAASALGEERARQLSRGIPDLPGALLAKFYRPELEAVLAADPDDALKLADRYRRLLAEADYDREIQVLARDSKWVEMIALTDRHISGQSLAGEALQAALLNRAAFERRAGQAGTAEETLRKVIATDGVSEFGVEAKRQLAEDGKKGTETSAPPRAQPTE